MKRILLALFIIGFVATACLKPPRDNEYDPDNPDKAAIMGVVEGPEGKIDRALVTLLVEEEVYDTTRTDPEGRYEITDVDPGIYIVTVKAPLFTPVEFSPESLSAGDEDTVDFYLGEHLFTFDNETPGTIEPFDFRVVVGAWEVKQDNTQPEEHSVPNVYNCTDSVGLALYNPMLTNHNIAANFKVSSSDTSWQAGFVLRMKDSQNYYLVAVAQSSIFFIKMEAGNPIPLDFAITTSNADSWHYLYAEACDQTFSIYLDYEKQFDVTDSLLTIGNAGLWCSQEIGGEPVSVHFDDVTICH